MPRPDVRFGSKADIGEYMTQILRRLSRAQSRDLGLQFRDAFVALGKRCLDIRRFETLRDVLWAIRVPGQNPEQDHLLWPRSVALGHQRFDELVVAFYDSGFPPPQIFTRFLCA